MNSQFTWIEIYQELANTLSHWQERQPELIAYLEGLREQGFVITALQDKNSDGERFLLSEIDPFTFMGVFNRGIRDQERSAILGQLKDYFHLQSPAPTDFAGIPVLNNMKSWLFPYQEKREIGHIATLWNIFQLALQENPLENEKFLQTLDKALSMHGVNVNLTMGLFWIRPDTFLSLDQVNRSYLDIKLPTKGLNSKFYLKVMQSLLSKRKSFPEISHEAWLEANSPKGEEHIQNISLLLQVNR